MFRHTCEHVVGSGVIGSARARYSKSHVRLGYASSRKRNVIILFKLRARSTIGSSPIIHNISTISLKTIESSVHSRGVHYEAGIIINRAPSFRWESRQLFNSEDALTSADMFAWWVQVRSKRNGPLSWMRVPGVGGKGMEKVGSRRILLGTPP